jgi:putative endopeptidase
MRQRRIAGLGESKTQGAACASGIHFPSSRSAMQPFRFAAIVLMGTGIACAQSSLTPNTLRELDGLADTPSSTVTEPKAPKSFDLSAMDTTADPCTDFYQYACGNWMKQNPIPADQSRWGNFNMLAERNQWLLYKDLEAAAKPSPSRTPLEAKYGDFYASCMNVDAVNAKGAAPLKPALDRIAGLNDKKQLAAVLTGLERENGTDAIFNFEVQQDEKDSSLQIAAVRQGGLGLPDRSYYIEKAERETKIRDQYVEHMTKMFVLAGDTPEQAAAEAKSVMAIETALAEGSLSRTDLREPTNRYHIKTVAELEQMAPGFDWSTYFGKIGIGSFESLNVAQPGFIEALNKAIEAESLDAWKSYLRWHAIHDAAPWLSDNFVQENYNFYNATLQGAKELQPRWKRCTRLTDIQLGEAVGQDWVRKNFPPAAKENMTKLVAALDKALGEDIQQLPWMGDETKKAAEAKLALYRNKIGYPDNWRDYSKFTVERGDLMGNVNRGSEFEQQRNLNKLGKPVDETEWGMTPPTVNAYYEPSLNDINFPAGILQPPFYSLTGDEAVNFGGIGVVIGHEMTHGFDDEGSKYDGKGNLREWQTPADRKAFTERTDCEVQEYDKFAPEPGSNVNGKLTLGENTADNGGIRIAFLALENTLAAQSKQLDGPKQEGFTPAQRFFIGFGQIWCESRRPEYSRMMVKVDPHSPGKFRVNGTVQNFEEFGKAFGCKKGAPMYPENACRVW